MTLISFGAATVLAAIHLLARRLRFLNVTPRSRWLSAAGGVSVAYVFVHLLPELAEGQRTLEEGGLVLGFLDRHAYLVALGGVTVFYGLERLVRQKQRGEASGDGAGWAFRLHLASFAVYNALIGYLLVYRVDSGASGLAWYGLAMALHFLVSDHGLREIHRAAYHRWGRWVLAGAVLLGWAGGQVTELREVIVVLLTAFLGGGVVLNVMKEELPEERESRFSAFLAGAAIYSLILLLG